MTLIVGGEKPYIKGKGVVAEIKRGEHMKFGQQKQL